MPLPLAFASPLAASAFLPARLPAAAHPRTGPVPRAARVPRRARMTQQPAAPPPPSEGDSTADRTPGLSESFAASTPPPAAQTPPPPSASSADATAAQAASSDAASDESDVRQLLGMKGAAATTDKWRIRLQLMKPVTWIPLIWGVTCGAAASGNFHWSDPVQIAQSLACMVLAGPLLTGYTQVINDWYDREIDAINEPYRPIPAGLVSETDVKVQIAALLAAGFALSFGLDVWAGHAWPVNTALTTFGVFVAYIYSAPPLKLKQNGWAGSYALGASYISLPWWAGQALFGTLDWKVMVLTLFYSLAGLGIAIVNDFKSVDGDRATGMQSLPVMFGVDAAKWICVGMIDVFQLLVALALFLEGETPYAAGIVALVLPQMFFQFKYFLKDPIANDVKYQASAQPFLVLGILVAGLAVGHHGPL